MEIYRKGKILVFIKIYNTEMAMFTGWKVLKWLCSRVRKLVALILSTPTLTDWINKYIFIAIIMEPTTE